MTLEDIIEVLNSNVELCRTAQQLDTNLGHLVLQRTIDVNPTFKSYKKFYLVVWFVKDKKKSKVLSVEKQTSYSTYDKDMTKLDKEFIKHLFNLIGDKEIMDSIIYGTYTDS